MQQVHNNIYRISTPLPGSPLKEVGCYIIPGKAGGRSLMIDTGFNQDVCYRAIMEGLDALGLSLEQTDIFLTHLHADHSGLCARLKRDENRVFIRACDGERVNGFLTQEYWENLAAMQLPMGIPEEERMDYRSHPAYINRTDAPVAFTHVNDGSRFSVGGYELEAVDLAGHTPGQLGLWSMQDGLLFSGDHILQKITPNICLWDMENDYLEIYMRNLRKVKTMQLQRVFTAHRAILDSPDGRIDELLAHHAKRLDEICRALEEQGALTVWQTAHSIGWDFGTGVFADFPDNQKWFGALEVFAHLEHLRRIERISCTVREKARIYALKH